MQWFLSQLCPGQKHHSRAPRSSLLLGTYQPRLCLFFNSLNILLPAPQPHLFLRSFHSLTLELFSVHHWSPFLFRCLLLAGISWLCFIHWNTYIPVAQTSFLSARPLFLPAPSIPPFGILGTYYPYLSHLSPSQHFVLALYFMVSDFPFTLA